MAVVCLSLSRSRLIQRWVENIVEAVKAANKDSLPVEKIRPHMDNLTSQLLALSELILMYIQLYMYTVCMCKFLFNFNFLAAAQYMHVLWSGVSLDMR